MCNCNPNPADICTQCRSGNTCGCPPNYSILPEPVPCGCCPGGYTFTGPTPNWPNGYCSNGTSQVAPIPCNQCAETLSADCIILPAIPCYGIAAGMTLTNFIVFMCSNPVFIQKILSNIGLSTTLGSGFCQLVQNCPSKGSGTTPVIGPIIITYP